MTLELIKFENQFGNEVSSYGNPEFKIGGNLTGNTELSLFANYFVKNTSKDSLDKVKINGYSYGLAYSIYPSKFGIYFIIRAGFENTKIIFTPWNGSYYLPSTSLTDNKPFISLQIRLLSTVLDGQVLRLWHKPLFY